MGENHDDFRRDARESGNRLLAEHLSDDPFAAAFKATRMPMIITDPRQRDNPIIFSNIAFSELTGFTQEELIGRNCRLLQGPETDPESIERIRRAIRAEESISVDILNYRKDGSGFWNALFISPVHDQTGKVVYFFASLLDFTHVKAKQSELAAARRSAEEEVVRRTKDLQDALDAKTLLVHEVDHRVKNNLLTIASILKLQARTTKDETVRGTLRSVLDTVEALSTVQRKLFTTSDVERFDVADFVHDLAVDVLSALRRDDIHISFDLSPVLVPAIKASPLALIINELVGDSLRRGLRDRGGTIHICIKQQDGHLIIQVIDDMDAVDVDAEGQAFSRTILETCARQVNAAIDRHTKGRQTTVEVKLAVDSMQGAPQH